MTKNKTLAAFAVASLLASGYASSFVIGPSNFGFGGYPEPNCRKPIKPTKPYSMSESWEVDMYNNRVRSYNAELQTYVLCVRNYVEAANLDVKRIQERVEELVSEAERDYY